MEKKEGPEKKIISDCWSCYGVNFFSEELKKAGKSPICFGYDFVVFLVLLYNANFILVSKQNLLKIFGLKSR
jgi:hypothetical protein